MSKPKPRYYFIGKKATPPASSYWVGATRAELLARIAARRSQQRSATPLDITHDPALGATAALRHDHAPRWKVGH